MKLFDILAVVTGNRTRPPTFANTIRNKKEILRVSKLSVSKAVSHLLTRYTTLHILPPLVPLFGY